MCRCVNIECRRGSGRSAELIICVGFFGSISAPESDWSCGVKVKSYSERAEKMGENEYRDSYGPRNTW